MDFGVTSQVASRGKTMKNQFEWMESPKRGHGVSRNPILLTKIGFKAT